MNAIVTHVAKSSVSQVIALLSAVRWADGATPSWITKISHASLFVEWGLADFGYPDLMIVTTAQDESHCVFIEAKVGPYISSMMRNRVGMREAGFIAEGADVRTLPDIIKNPEARKKLEKGARETAFAEAKRIVEASKPEATSEFFKLLAKAREAFTDATQVKEILKIRTDKVAKQRLLDTYMAMVDFMRLADVEPPETN